MTIILAFTAENAYFLAFLCKIFPLVTYLGLCPGEREGQLGQGVSRDPSHHPQSQGKMGVLKHSLHTLLPGVWVFQILIFVQNVQ